VSAGRWIVGVIAVLGASAAGAWMYFGPLEGSVEATVIPNDSSCSDPEQPIAVKLRNGSFRTLTWVTFDVGTKRRGYSTKLTREKYPTDKLMAPGEETVWCVRKPQTMWLNGFDHPVSDLPADEETEYYVDIIAVDAD
jgi:hypothetical protein